MEQKQDKLRIKESIGKVRPCELGRMFKDYYNKYLKVADTSEPFKEALDIFDGLVPVTTQTLDDVSTLA